MAASRRSEGSAEYVLRTLAPALTLFAIAMLALLVALLVPDPASSSHLVQVVVVVAGVLAAAAGTVAAVVPVVVRAVRGEITRQLDTVVTRNSDAVTGLAREIAMGMELSVLGAIPPARALDIVLGNVYGRSEYNRDVTTSLLGGEGLQMDQSDLTISEQTDVEYRLARVDEDNYQLTMQVGYTFKNRVPTDKFVIFATSDAMLRETIVLGCRQPLFELWFVPDDPVSPLFHDSVDEMLPSVRIGLRFLDTDGYQHEEDHRHPHLEEVRVGRWEEYLTFFREPVGGLPRLRPEDYMGSLRVFEVDLREMVHPGVQVADVQRLSLSSITLQRVDDGFCYWQAPYPCFLDRMQIDAAPLALSGHDDFVFRLQAFAFRSQPSPARWSPAEHVKELSVRSWLLPGHGVVLLWKRVVDGSGPH